MGIVVLEFVSLLWSHPILTGLLILLFTTPLFHIVLFFTPLLMSTALCVIALISIGPQIEKIREERQFKMSLNARALAAAERPVNRYIVIRQGRPQRPGGGGGRRWSDWVKGIEIHGHTVWLSESHIMRDIAEEGLKSDFSHEDGGIPITCSAQDVCSNHKGAFSLEVETSGSIINVEEEEEEEERRPPPPPGGLDGACRVQEGQQQEHQGENGRESEREGESGMNGDSDEHVKACGVNEDGLIINSNTGVVVGVEDSDDASLEQPRTGDGVYWPERNRLLELIAVEDSPPVCRLLGPGESPRVGLEVSTRGVGKKARRRKKKLSAWFGRRRIPCLSKALGQLSEKICNQIRRIFS